MLSGLDELKAFMAYFVMVCERGVTTGLFLVYVISRQLLAFVNV